MLDNEVVSFDLSPFQHVSVELIILKSVDKTKREERNCNPIIFNLISHCCQSYESEQVERLKIPQSLTAKSYLRSQLSLSLLQNQLFLKLHLDFHVLFHILVHGSGNPHLFSLSYIYKIRFFCESFNTRKDQFKQFFQFLLFVHIYQQTINLINCLAAMTTILWLLRPKKIVLIYLIIISQYMNKEFNLARLQQSNVKQLCRRYHFIEMGCNYPFGELRFNCGQDTEILVCKKNYYSFKSQESVLNEVSSLLEHINHHYLINFHHLAKQQNVISFYYEYAHLKIEKWILDLGDQIIVVLKNQMLSLLQFLNKQNICFRFSDKNIGLSNEIQIKYFLDQFYLASDEKIRINNFKMNQEKIEDYFNDLKEEDEIQRKKTVFSSQIVPQNQKYNSQVMLSSIATRQSWSPVSLKMSNLFAKKTSNNQKICYQLEKSKSKINEILQRLRNVKNLQF